MSVIADTLYATMSLVKKKNLPHYQFELITQPQMVPPPPI